MEKLVSVIIPTRGRHDLLCETVASVANQSYDDVELIVVDDGSEVPVKADVESVWLESRPAHMLNVVRQEPSNSNVARNRGFDTSSGEFVIFLDSDDLLAVHCISERIKVLDVSDWDYVATVAQIFAEKPGDREVVWNLPDGSSELHRFLTGDAAWPTSGCLWRKSFLKSTDCWLTDLTSYQDLEFHARMLLGGARGKYLPVVDQFVRVEENHISISTNWNSIQGWKNLLRALESLCMSMSKTQHDTKKNQRRLSQYAYRICSSSCGLSGSEELVEKALQLAKDYHLLSTRGVWWLRNQSQTKSVYVSLLLHLFRRFFIYADTDKRHTCSKRTSLELLGKFGDAHAFRLKNTQTIFFGGELRFKDHLLAESIFYLSQGKIRPARNSASVWVRNLF